MSSSQNQNDVPEEVLDFEERWLNEYQLAILSANPRVAAIEAGRRGGKTEEILAERTLNAMSKMPGSGGFLSGKSYSKLLDHMLAPLITGWAKRGFKEFDEKTGEGDFIIGSKPPKHFKLPIMKPQKWDHYLCTSWGSGAHLMSQDHAVTGNSLTTDWGAIDEAKQHEPERAQSELFKTMSGHRSVRIDANTIWGDIPEHLQLTLLSDKYIGQYDYRWLDQYKEKSISQADFFKMARLAERVQKTKSPHLQRELWEMQCKATVYLEYSSRASLPVIGIDYYKQQAEGSTNIDFLTSILNEEVEQIEGGFYPFLSKQLHTYKARDNAKIDLIGISEYLRGKNKTCIIDKDWRTDLPIKLSVDYGSSQTWYVNYQVYNNTYYLQNNFWSNDGEDFLIGLDRFCNYHKPHQRRIIELYDDPAGHKNRPDQSKDVNKVIQRLREHKWEVRHQNPGNAYVSHHDKYRIMGAVMNESDKRNPKAPKLQINYHNAYQTYYSMSKAPIKIGNNQFEKDKRSEGKQRPGEEWKATHLSDAADNPICFDNRHLADGKGKFLF